MTQEVNLITPEYDLNGSTETEVSWIDPEDDSLEAAYDVSFTEYDISASPNDFNIKTLVTTQAMTKNC